MKQRFLKASRLPESDTIELDAETIFKQYQEYAERLRDYVGETTNYLLDSVESGKPLFEGRVHYLISTTAHSRLLRVATRPVLECQVDQAFRQWITRTIGVLKAYSTRVGGGPLPTEQENEIGKHLQERGKEFGTDSTTTTLWLV